jgi:hypothetical protein
MSLSGIIHNGVVVLDSGCPLPDGTRVEVVPKAEETRAAENGPTLLGLLELAGTVDDLPPDMARNHDHYIHGAPKR